MTEINYEQQVHEYATLGCIIKDNTLIQDTVLREEYFRGNCRILYKAMCELVAEGKPIDMVSLLSKQIQNNFGGVATINECNNRSNVLKFNDYVNIVIEKWQEREKLNILSLASQENWKLDQITNELSKLQNNNVNDRYDIADLMKRVYEMPWKQQDKKKGVHTGFKSLDLMTGGFQNGSLNIFGARPSIGKTDFLLNSAIAAGLSGAKPIIFSMEMTAQEELDLRVIANIGNYNRTKMNDPFTHFKKEEKDRWVTVIGEVSKTNLTIFDKSKQSVKEIYAKTRKIIKENPDKQVIVYIDYLTLMKPSENFKTIEHSSVSEMTKDLKVMAKELNIPVVCLAQLSRSIESRPDKHPLMSDLRESGGIEEDANLVGLLYRDSYYTKDVNDNSFEITIAKNRAGAVGLIKCAYNRFTGKLTEVM